jgi:hypothetical protein
MASDALDNVAAIKRLAAFALSNGGSSACTRSPR